jgi:transposase
MIQLGAFEHVRDEEREELAGLLKAEYLRGASIRDLAERCGRSYGFCHRLLKEAGTDLRPRGGDRVQRPKTDTPA